MIELLNGTPVMYVQLLVALGLGILIGLERTLAHKTAGMRTYGLVSMGSCLFIILSLLVANSSLEGSDPSMRIAAGIITGIGFLCGGVIIFQNHQLSGLTTAAGLWLTAGIGMTVGFGEIKLATFATIITLIVFTVIWFIEHLITGTKK